jgi:hypothetical protein
MASRKQRRRREKERRHEYEYVYVDDEGREVAVEEAEPAKSNGKARPAQSVRTVRGRKIDPPSWRRTLRRAAIFAPLMFVIVYFLRAKDATTASVLLQVIMLLAFFIPFSYFMDSFMFRLAQKRAAQARGSSAKGDSPRS